MALVSIYFSFSVDLDPPSDKVIQLRIPEDVHWFDPDTEGWLCDYQYVQRRNGGLHLKILPRNTGLGQIMVYSEEQFRAILVGIARPEGMIWKRVFQRNYAGGEGWKTVMIQRKWFAVARTQWGMFDRLFVITADFGGNTALVDSVSSFSIDQEIPCHTGFVGWTKDNFPGVDAVNHRLRAYS